MTASATHNGWLTSRNNGILAAVKNGALNGASILATNTALTGVLVGTPVTPALAADSMVISNLVASGDLLIAANNGGNSQAWLWIDASAGTMTLYGAGTAALTLSSTAVKSSLALSPLASNGAALGSASLMWADLFLASGAVINFDNGNATITHSAAVLTVDGAAMVFNEASADLDFRIESNGNANMFVLDGGLDAIGIGGAAATSQTLTVTNATLNATAGRVAKFSGTGAAPNLGDGYGAVEVDITFSGTVAGTSAAFSSWVNLASGAVPGGNMICAQNNGIYLPSGITASSAKMIMGARMQYVADDGANPGSLFCFSTNIYSNVLTAIFDVNAIGDLGGSTGAQTGNDYKIPLLKDESAGVVWYVNVYHT